MSGAARMAPRIKRVRAYFGPVNRTAQQAAIFDAAQSGDFSLDSPGAPWIDLGWISGFKRTSETAITQVKTGAPTTAHSQARTSLGAKVAFAFESWGKLQMSLAAGTQQMNLLQAQSGATPAGSGGVAVPAVAILSGSNATALNVGATAAAAFRPGMLVAVDVDLTPGATGFVGSGVSGAYLRTAISDVDYVRRVTLNVGRVIAVSNGVLTLESPLLAGVPGSSMKVSGVVGFCDREGSSFFQEWSAVFVAEGQQNERVIWYYPRLQAAVGIAEMTGEVLHDYATMRLAGEFRALPVKDFLDGEQVLCFRSFLTAQ